MVAPICVCVVLCVLFICITIGAVKTSISNKWELPETQRTEICELIEIISDGVENEDKRIDLIKTAIKAYYRA